jgi:hypothetical protein
MGFLRASNLKNSAPYGYTAEGLLHLTRSLSRIVAEGRGNLNAVKALFGLISSPILDLELFLKPMPHKVQEGVCKEIQV